MYRRKFIAAGLAVMTGGVAGPLESALTALAPRLAKVPSPSRPSRATPDDVAWLRTMAASYESRAHIDGGGASAAIGDIYTAGLADIAKANGILDIPCPDGLRSDLLSAVAWLYRAVGFVAFDRGAYPLADDMVSRALGLAREAGQNPSLEARIAGTRARQLSWTGDQDGAQHLIRGALRLQGLTYTEYAMLHALHARSLALSGDERGTLGEIEHSDHCFERITSGEMFGRPWSAAFSRSDQRGDTGRALLDLSLATSTTKHLPEATERHLYSVRGHDASTRRRSLALTEISVAMSHVLSDAPDEALSHGRAAIGLSAGESFSSRRVEEEFRRLRSAAHARFPGNHSARTLSDAIDYALIA